MGERKPRGTCRLCGREWALLKDGSLRGHWCPGTPGTLYHQGGGVPVERSARAKPPGENNMRGVAIACTGEVITHLRDSLWLVELKSGRRVTMDRRDFEPASVPAAAQKDEDT